MNYPLLYQWERLLSAHLPGFNSWQRANVALFSYGVIQAKAASKGQLPKPPAVESKWKAPRGGFGAGWTTRRWTWGVFRGLESLGGELCRGAEITLLVDETKLHDRIGVMLVGVAWQGRCLPLAWRTYRANSEAAYPAEGQVGMICALLQAVKAGIGDLASVLVLADRGLAVRPPYAGWSKP